MDAVVEGSGDAQQGRAGRKTSKRSTVTPPRLALPN
jgi:hypothetical protein